MTGATDSQQQIVTSCTQQPSLGTPGEEGSEAAAADQEYLDDRVEVLLGRAVPVPFPKGDPAHTTASLMPERSQPWLLPQIPPGYEALRPSDRAGRQKPKKGHLPGPGTAR